MTGDVLEFSRRPSCPKCTGIGFSWQYTPTSNHMLHTRSCPEVFGDKGEHLDLTCRDCGYTIGMRTADNK